MPIAALQLKARRWTVDEYHRLIEAAFFRPDEHLELIDGVILPMSPQSAHHACGVSLIEHALRDALGDGLLVRVQAPLTLAAVESEPEPDVAVVRGTIRQFFDAQPTDAELVVEVSYTSVDFDLGEKAALYARAGIAEYWVLDGPRALLVVHRAPSADGYDDVAEHGAGAVVHALCAQAPIAVADLLPGPE